MRTLWVALAWVLGVYLGFRLRLPPAALVVIVSLSIALSIVLRKRPRILLLALVAAALFGGALRTHFTLASSQQETLHLYNDTGSVTLRGIVTSDPDPRGNLAQFTLSAREMRRGGGWTGVSGDVLVRARPNAELSRLRQAPYFKYGDELEVSGQLQEPSSYGDFDYRDYLAKQGIRSEMSLPEVQLLHTGRGFRPMEWLYTVRQKLASSLNRVLPEPQAAVAQALLLGKRSSIPEGLAEAFNRSGTTHMLSISGLHVSVVLGMAVGLGRRLAGRRRLVSLLLPLALVWLYSLLAGLAPPVQRAAIMGSFFLVGTHFGRQRSGAIALALAAAFIVGVNPTSLWQVSFQLSFLAMAGLVFLAPTLEARGQSLAGRFFKEGTSWRGVSNWVIGSVAVSAAAVIATTPLIALYFHRFSLVSILATMVALPALPPALAASFLAALAGMAWLPLGQVIGWVAWLALSYTTGTVTVFGALPMASVDVGSLSRYAVWAYYVALAVAVVALRRAGCLIERVATGVARAARFHPLSPAWADRGVVFLCSLALLAWIAVGSVRDGYLHVTFLDVGQGDAALIQTPSGHNILVDGGPDPRPVLEELGRRLPAWSRRLDLVVLTHPHSDHVGGLPEVLRRYEVKGVLQGDTTYQSPSYAEWSTRLEALDIPVTTARAGQVIKVGDVVLEVLNPQAPPLAGTDSDVDNNSVVLRLSYGSVSFLLTGDAWSQAEDFLVRQGAPLRSTVLKVAHHGSQTSSSKAFVQAVQPYAAVISAGENNRFDHPHPSTIATLKEQVNDRLLFLTMRDGSVEFATDGERLWVKTGTKQGGLSPVPTRNP